MNVTREAREFLKGLTLLTQTPTRVAQKIDLAVTRLPRFVTGTSLKSPGCSLHRIRDHFCKCFTTASVRVRTPYLPKMRFR